MQTSNTESALLAAIRAAPADDLPRLVYADWLDERGGHWRHALAAYIRANCDSPALRIGPPGQPATDIRAGVYLADPLPGVRWVTSRGFVCGCVLGVSDWHHFAAAITAAHPIEFVILSPRAGWTRKQRRQWPLIKFPARLPKQLSGP